MTRLAPRSLLSSCLRGQCRLTLWEPWTPGPSRRAPPRPFRRSQLCTLLASATAPAISGALSTRPQRRRRRCRIQRSELLPSRDALRPDNRARRTPVRAGVASATVANRWVGAFRTRTLFPESGLCSHRCGPWGLWIRFSTRSAALAWT